MKNGMAVNRFGFFVLGMIAMVILCGLHAQGQSVAGGGGSIQAPYSNTVVMPDHAAHATQHDMATEQTLLGNNAVTEAHGERPLWDFPDDRVPEKPLGTVAREYREGLNYTNRKKAVITLEK